MGDGERACVPDAPIEPKFAMNVRVNEVWGAGRSQREGSQRTSCRRAESRELDRDARLQSVPSRPKRGRNQENLPDEQ